MARKKRRNTTKKDPLFILLLLLLAGGVSYLTSYSGYGFPETLQEAFSPFPEEVRLAEGIEIPVIRTPRREQLIVHEGYTVSYNADWCIPNWVAYELTAAETQGSVKRGNKFIPDPQVKGRTATTEDYTHSGYDRGHMAPSADMKWSTYAMAQCFYLSNICPQNGNLNKGDWRELEEKGRAWALHYEHLYIVCGPFVEKGYRTLGKNKVAVPSRFFKVFFRNAGPHSALPHGIGFIFENQAGSHPLARYAVCIDKVEEESGIDFFPSLPDELEQRIESECNPADWGL